MNCKLQIVSRASKKIRECREQSGWCGEDQPDISLEVIHGSRYGEGKEPAP